MGINISLVHPWTAFFIILYLVWFYRFYLNDANSKWEILGIKIDKSAFFLLSTLAVKLGFHIYLYKTGFVVFTGDSATRTIRAYKWSLAPHLAPYSDPFFGGWMPFYRYIHGLLFMLADDVIWIPRLTAFLASCILLVYFFKFIRCIFAEKFVPYFAVLILLFHHWYVFASGTPLLETYFMAFFMCGLYYVTLWSRENKNIHLFLSSFLFMLASGFHYQIWPVINSVNLIMLYFLVDFYKRKDYRKSGKLLLFFFLNNLWIIIYVLGRFYNTGTMNVFKGHMHGSGTLFTWENLSMFSKLAYYPALVLKNGSLIMWGLLLVGVFHAIKNRKNILGMSPLLIAAISLIAFSIFNLAAPPAAARAGRFCMVFIVLLIPHMAYGLDCIFNERHTVKIRFVLVFILGLVLFSNISRSLDFTRKDFLEFRSAINAGACINDVLNKSKFNAGYKFIIEKARTSPIVALASKHPHQVAYDRKQIKLIKLRNAITACTGINDILKKSKFDADHKCIIEKIRTSPMVTHPYQVKYNRKRRKRLGLIWKKIFPSVLRRAPIELKEYLLAKNVKYVIVRSKDLKKRFERLPFALEEKKFGVWAVYKIHLLNGN